MRDKLNISKAIACSLIATSLGTLSAAAGARQRDPDVLSRTIGFSDLDLTRDEGAATLYSRLRVAASEVCPAALIVDVNCCTAHALSRAVADVNAPKLTTYYQAKGRQPAQSCSQD
ncbi:MAG: UrcA family protein [Sinobacteraceae bacterium]|nr:UrcA family protein [Nevskiaceae bacterium]